jgi:hypothetical protein
MRSNSPVVHAEVLWQYVGRFGIIISKSTLTVECRIGVSLYCLWLFSKSSGNQWRNLVVTGPNTSVLNSEIT